MLTAFGKELRKLRIDRGELIIDMARKLGKSASYISSIETGKRTVPEDMIDLVVKNYGLNTADRKRLMDAKDASLKEVRVNLDGLDPNRRDLAFILARKLDSFEDEEIDVIRQFINKRK